MFQTALEILGRQADEARAWLNDCNAPGALGRLELDPALPIPELLPKRRDSHSSRAAITANSRGFLYHWTDRPVSGPPGRPGRMGWQLARGLPRKNYRRILDLGCGIGKSAVPYCDLYPNAEVVGLDYAAPMLKYGHKLAEARGKKVRFVQRRAEYTGFPDESFDLAVAIWLFHELPRKARDQVVARSASAWLRPGGVFAIKESPPFQATQRKLQQTVGFPARFDGPAHERPLDTRVLQGGSRGNVPARRFRCSPRLGAAQRTHRLGTGESYFFGAYPW